ncbi:unnamed protein product [Arabis nemorensis]|uniref:SGNH hydrolase-type esterase domain-containing protein n=1 Tax=Arabis nemorensis TaxID=586526 RepID=A0A565CGW9_9BRAS|nr:unnamed protein product [Arabis nemorensis]
MTTQISLFEHLIGDVYSQSDLSSSLALVSVAGNDYANFLASNTSFYVRRHSLLCFTKNYLYINQIFKISDNVTNGPRKLWFVELFIFILYRTLHALPGFIKKVVDQTKVNLRRIHTLGVKKIVVPSLAPLGCIPSFVKSSLIQGRCNDILNLFVDIHNALLHQVVTNLNNETNHTTFVIFYYNNAFSTVFKNKGENPGSTTTFKTPFKACCEGTCSVVDAKGVKDYTLFDDPKSAFFWDGLHPTQEGSRAVYAVLAKNITASLTISEI